MTAHPALTIGALADKTGCNVPTIRYYEEIGLLPLAARRPGGHRVYDDADLRRLTLVRRCREFGFPIEQVRVLVGLVEDGNRSCLKARDLAQTHLDAVRAKLAELRALEAHLQSFVETCTAACAGGPAPECTILEDLSTPSPQTAASTKSRCCG